MNIRPDRLLPLFTVLSPFYDPSPYKDVNICLRKIEEEFSISIKKYSYLRWAFDNDVFIINDHLVFRFPRSQRSKDHLKYEIEFLNFLDDEDKVRVKIPKYTYISKNIDFAGYEKISGKILSPSAFKVLNKDDKEKVANQLIDFINNIHNLPLETFIKYKPRTKEYFIPVEKRIENELEKKLFPKLSKKDVYLIKQFYIDSKRLLQNTPNNLPIHGDLYPYNVIWNNDTSKIGIIDFSDIEIGDPASDFEVFYDYGEPYINMAYEKYTGPKDENFLKRAGIYYKVHGIYTLLSSLLGAKISFDYAYKYFFKKKFNL